MKRFVILIAALFCMTANAADFPQTPNPTLTPGAVNPTATVSIICVRGYTSGNDVSGNKVRNVSEATKRQVFAEYGIDPKSSHFEIDHLISLELGGSNDIKNLWPQSYDTQPYNAHVKDALEDRLHSLVCSGKVSLADAQHDISTDWIAAYNKYVMGQ